MDRWCHECAKGIAGARPLRIAADRVGARSFAPVDANETEIGTRSGSSDTRDAAMAAAKRAIDNALDPKKRKLLPPT
jgi:hypothetical protein